MGYVHDPRHRYSYELRPDAALDARLRSIAAGLEADGLLEQGAATAPRFHPHLTLLRAREARLPGMGVPTRVSFAERGSFGDGRIQWLAPELDEPLRHLRSELVAQLGAAHVDPLVFEREWTPHLTLAYAVPEPARAEAAARITRELPMAGKWASLEVWDLDVRPTLLIHRLTAE